MQDQTPRFDDAEWHVIRFLYSYWRDGIRVVIADELKRFLNSINRPEAFGTVTELLIHHSLIECADVRDIINTAEGTREKLHEAWRILPALCDILKQEVKATNETTPPASPSSGVKPVDDETAEAAQYAALLESVKSLADGSLKGIQRRVTVLLVEAGGTKAIADIATDKAVGWLAPFKNSVDGYLKHVRPKLQPLGADVKPFDKELRLVLREKTTRPRRSTKKVAPLKRRQIAAPLPPKRR